MAKDFRSATTEELTGPPPEINDAPSVSRTQFLMWRRNFLDESVKRSAAAFRKGLILGGVTIAGFALLGLLLYYLVTL